MRVILQRVQHASVTVEGRVTGKIGEGLLILFGVEVSPNLDHLEWLADKIINMRVFKDDEGKMNQSLLDIGGDLLLVSQFTLFASTKKGNRPSYTRSAPPDQAREVYENMIKMLSDKIGKPVETGIFGANMDVELLNQGPVTIMLDTKNRDL